VLRFLLIQFCKQPVPCRNLPLLRIAGTYYPRFLLYLLFHFLPLITTAQNRYDILITEFLPDPSPSAGLPESEFIELKNRSSQDYNLRNWKISNGSSNATIKSDYILKADSFLILCTAAASVSYASFGSTLGISGFPSLNNDAGEIILSTDAGEVIHAFHYDRSWFDNEMKAAGGWSLEMIDPANPCTGRTNWTASISPVGGTPGKKNSVYTENPDLESPSLIRAIAIDSLDMILIFDEALDSSSVSNSLNFSVSDGIGYPENAQGITPFFDRVEIHLQNPIMAGKIYTVSALQIRDCSGNEIGLNNSCKTGLPTKVKPGDIIFNEILFNPPPFGYDYLELYNRSSDIINSSELWLESKDFNGNLKNPIPIMKEDRAFLPGEYLLLTENPDWILHRYPLADAARIISVSPMPSMPDDIGKVALLNGSGNILDELDYDHHWHSPLLANESGVSLERIRIDLPTGLSSNWTSAAATAGYGTPGYKNSEYSMDSITTNFITVEPKVFSPDMDGYQDFLFIHYNLPNAGFIGSISIYDIYGRLVKLLVNNILWGTAGTFRWDGLDDQQNRLPIGHYIIYIEIFRTDGTVIRQKLVCVLARSR
jgi:Lamin Tail Domain